MSSRSSHVWLAESRVNATERLDRVAMSSAPSAVLFCKNAFVTDRNNAFVTTLSSDRRDEIQETCRRKLFPLSSSVTGGLGKADRSSGLEGCHFYGRLRQA